MGKVFTLTRTRVYAPINCAVCGDSFTPKSSSAKICGKSICKKRYVNGKILKFFPDKVKHNVRKIRGYIANTKYKITDERVERDITSPTGKSYIGVSKRPLVRIKDGFGYMGVLLQTDNRMFVQCHVCGKWMRSIGSAHAELHNMSLDKYRKKFGLYEDKALISDSLSYSLEERGRKRFYMNQDAIIEKLREGAEKAREIQRKKKIKLVGLAEHDNKYATCERQLGFRLLEYIKQYHILPSRSHKGKGKG